MQYPASFSTQTRPIEHRLTLFWVLRRKKIGHSTSHRFGRDGRAAQAFAPKIRKRSLTLTLGNGEFIGEGKSGSLTHMYAIETKGETEVPLLILSRTSTESHPPALTQPLPYVKEQQQQLHNKEQCRQCILLALKNLTMMGKKLRRWEVFSTAATAGDSEY